MKRIATLYSAVCAIALSVGISFASDNYYYDPCSWSWTAWTNDTQPSLSVLPVNLETEPPEIGEVYSVGIEASSTPGTRNRVGVYSCTGQVQYQAEIWPTFSSTNSEFQITGGNWFYTPENPTPNHGMTATFTPTANSGSVLFTVTLSGPFPPWSTTTNITIPFSVLNLDPMLLDRWRFNDTWLGDDGHGPIVTANVEHVTGWNYGALQVNSIGAFLGYASRRSDGIPVVTRNLGTVRFWFKPDWSTGVGPRATAKLFEMQNNSGAQWCLSVDPQGQHITLSTPGWGGLVGNINWTAGSWYQIAVTYTSSASEATQTAIYVNGILLAHATGTTMPRAKVQMFTVGNGADGQNPAMGVFDELDTFNYILNSIAGDYASALTIDSDNDGVTNFDELTHGTNPYNPDTDGDGYSDLPTQDYFPLDPNRWDPNNPNDITPPVVTLLLPISAVANN